MKTNTAAPQLLATYENHELHAPNCTTKIVHENFSHRDSELLMPINDTLHKTSSENDLSLLLF